MEATATTQNVVKVGDLYWITIVHRKRSRRIIVCVEDTRTVSSLKCSVVAGELTDTLYAGKKIEVEQMKLTRANKVGTTLCSDTAPTCEFQLTDSQKEKVKEWKEAIKKVFGESGDFIYSFQPTGTGNIVKVRSTKANIELDLTETESW